MAAAEGWQRQPVAAGPAHLCLRVLSAASPGSSLLLQPPSRGHWGLVPVFLRESEEQGWWWPLPLVSGPLRRLVQLLALVRSPCSQLEALLVAAVHW